MSDLAERLEKLCAMLESGERIQNVVGLIYNRTRPPARQLLAADLRTAAAALRREEKPAIWAIYATNGNIRMWTSIEELARAKAAEWGLAVTPLYAGPPSTGGAEP